MSSLAGQILMKAIQISNAYIATDSTSLARGYWEKSRAMPPLGPGAGDEERAGSGGSS